MYNDDVPTIRTSQGSIDKREEKRKLVIDDYRKRSIKHRDYNNILGWNGTRLVAQKL
jgi:hypothetical protein